MRGSPKKSISPNVAANNETMRPPSNSHAEMSAHSIAAVCQYTMSVTSVATKHTIGMGTSIAWRGRPQMLTVERGFMLGIAIPLGQSNAQRCRLKGGLAKPDFYRRLFKADSDTHERDC